MRVRGQTLQELQVGIPADSQSDSDPKLTLSGVPCTGCIFDIVATYDTYGMVGVLLDIVR